MTDAQLCARPPAPAGRSLIVGFFQLPCKFAGQLVIVAFAAGVPVSSEKIHRLVECNEHAWFVRCVPEQVDGPPGLAYPRPHRSRKPPLILEIERGVDVFQGQPAQDVSSVTAKNVVLALGPFIGSNARLGERGYEGENSVWNLLSGSSQLPR